MKLKIYVQILNKGCYPLVNPKGDLIDLRAGESVDLKCPQSITQYTRKDGKKFRDVIIENKLVPLGVRMLLPHGFKANVYPRSGTYKNFGVVLANSVGQIDNSYNGPKDEWKVNLVALKECHIEGPRPATESDLANKDLTIIGGYVQGDRVAQFEISLSQKATWKDKLKWLFSNGIELVYVDSIDTVVDRGGFSSSGVK